MDPPGVNPSFLRILAPLEQNSTLLFSLGTFLKLFYVYSI